MAANTLFSSFSNQQPITTMAARGYDCPPPDKRQRTDADLWGNDDLDITDALIETVDLMESQALTQQSAVEHNTTCTSTISKQTNFAAGDYIRQGQKFKTSNGKELSADHFGRGSSSCGVSRSYQSVSTSVPACTHVQTNVNIPSDVGRKHRTFQLAGESQAKRDNSVILQKEMNILKQELQKLKNEQYGKDGEIKILRNRLHKKEIELSTQKQENLKLLNAKVQEQNQRELNRQRELERLQTQLQFKEQEILEIQNQCSHLEQKLQPEESGATVNLSSPRKIKKSKLDQSPKSGFPTTHSFLSQSPKLEHRLNKFTDTSDLVIKAAISAADTAHVVCQTAMPGSQRWLNLSKPGGDLTGPQLVDKLVYNDEWSILPLISMGEQSEFDTDCTNTLSESNRAVAMQTISKLLTCQSETSLPVPLLGLIEDYLSCYLLLLNNQPAEDTASNAESSSPETENSDNDKMQSKQKYAVWVKNSMKRALNVLLNLLEYNTEIVASLLPDTFSDTEVDDGSCWKSVNVTHLRLADGRKIVIKIVEILNCLAKKINVREMELAECCLDVLICIAKKAQDSYLDRLFIVKSLKLVSTLLDPDCCYSLQSRFLELLTNLASSNRIVFELCTQNNACVLLAVYHLACWQGQQRFTLKQYINLQMQILQFLILVTSCHKGGVSLLLQTDCQCSSQVVKSVVVMLNAQLELYKSKKKSLWNKQHSVWPRLPDSAQINSCDDSYLSEAMQLLRQGVLFLHVLSLHDNMFSDHHYDVEHQYVNLICSMRLLYRELTDIPEHEVNAVHDLWDFEQEDPDSSKEDYSSSMEAEDC